jgi:putative NADH-flavin reductase
MLILLFVFVTYAIALAAALGLAGHRSRSTSHAGAPPGRVSRVLIIGATGGTGRQLVTQALDRGYVVTALVRDRSRLRIEHPQLKVIQGDVLDASAVGAAVRDQEAVLSALGHKRFFQPTRILSQGTATILRAMEAHGANRFVCETSLGIGDSVGRMGAYYSLFVVPVILPFYYWDKTRQERVIEASRVEWVIVRPGALTSKERRGQYRHGAHIGSFFWTVQISRADAASFMLDQLESNAYLRQAPGVCW